MIVSLNQHRHEKQYKKFYQSNLDLAVDTAYIHSSKNDLHKTYTQQWIKLLSDNVNKNTSYTMRRII
jgi:hypothetical protein